MERVSVVGNSGSGKTTFARRLAAHLDVPLVELDAIYHQPGWTGLPDDEFRARVGALTAATGWVVDGNYRAVRPAVWARADTVVVLDLPRAQVMARIVPRTLHRLVTRAELWNGNREQLRNLLSARKEESIILWSVTQHAKYRRRYLVAMHDPRWAHLRFVHLTSARRAEEWLARLAADSRQLRGR